MPRLGRETGVHKKTFEFGFFSSGWFYKGQETRESNYGPNLGRCFCGFVLPGARLTRSKTGTNRRPFFSKTISLAFANSSKAGFCGYRLTPNLALILVVMGWLFALIPRRWNRMSPNTKAAGLHSNQAILSHHSGMGPLINKPVADVLFGPVNGSSVIRPRCISSRINI
jgi:hypothetical protein